MIPWLHRRLGHTQDVKRITPPLLDAIGEGRLIFCSCGELWAR